jgi:hypothetical protein
VFSRIIHNGSEIWRWAWTNVLKYRSLLVIKPTLRQQENLRSTMNESIPFLPDLSPVCGKKMYARFDGCPSPKPNPPTLAVRLPTCNRTIAVRVMLQRFSPKQMKTIGFLGG